MVKSNEALPEKRHKACSTSGKIEHPTEKGMYVRKDGYIFKSHWRMTIDILWALPQLSDQNTGAKWQYNKMK